MKDRLRNILIQEYSTLKQTNPVINTNQTNSSQSTFAQSSPITSEQSSRSSRQTGSESPRKVRKLYDYSAMRSASPINASIKQEIDTFLNAGYEENVNTTHNNYSTL